MEIKEQTIFRELSQKDFGLDDKDSDAHVPQFFMVIKTLPKIKPSKAPEQTTTSKTASSTPQSTPLTTPRSTDTDDTTHTTRHLHISSEQGKEREKKRRKDNKRHKQQAKAFERDGYSLAKIKAAQEQAKAKVEPPKPSQPKPIYHPKYFQKTQTPIGAPPHKMEKCKGKGK